MGTYGGGPSYLDVTVTLSDNVITAVTVEPQAENETSLDYQERFAAVAAAVGRRAPQGWGRRRRRPRP
ncbi:hypothetical protein MLP_09300 [Microlunatus phosphovorus NM-1]|uniref:Uncharacterized protein n=1 Tax=Microlunatus phosphovorus (strain ATCC 700054 / DSM 10555 / JCM 9379 / NBRC 101784 / NCIMB 13414 / VKM Ac-1990 / NM-1) TaxID=1032480 RepID=F5XMM1_MICPN|nr:hypothetical protein MLP_09300 [Microlunatus phosphovorus NM-1]